MIRHSDTDILSALWQVLNTGVSSGTHSHVPHVLYTEQRSEHTKTR